MKHRDLWKELCSYKNLEFAYTKARKHKTQKPYVIQFESNLKNNLSLLRIELLLHAYRPKPLQTFILHDPKTRKICKSDFRDRVIHHALCNIIEPIFEHNFIFDSYANRKRKGTLKAIQRFEYFYHKVSRNRHQKVFVLKADIRHYFDEVDHSILFQIIKQKVKDPKILWIIQHILGNYTTKAGKGMPLGNLTSQFFANIYLNELDQFVKQELKVKCYIRYVDDFVVMDNSLKKLEEWKKLIGSFLQEHLHLDLHPDKSKIIPAQRGIDFLGLKFFPRHKIMRKRNI